MRLNQKFRISLAIFALVLTALLGGTMAYFATTETTHNVISSGGVKITLYELSDPTGSGTDLVPFEDITNIVPGMSYSKIPIIKNIDTEPVWVCSSLSLTKTSPEGIVTPIPDPSSAIELEGVGSNWTYLDGHYYYNLPLSADELTEPIFTSVKFNDSIDTSEAPVGTIYSLTIDAFATQTANNGTDPFTAGGWDD